MMKKIYQLIVSIPQDKLLHIIAGMLIAMVCMRIFTLLQIFSGWEARLLAMAIVVVVGALREIYNMRHGGKFDPMDWLASICGGLMSVILMI